MIKHDNWCMRNKQYLFHSFFAFCLIRWHRLDYYEIAPLNDPSEAQKGVLSRGGLVMEKRAYLRD